MAIYTPYFYIIQDKRNGMYYAGAKWAQDANPATFMTEGGYNTSSKKVKAIIESHDINRFAIRKIRTFEKAEDVIRYETRFLSRVDAKNNPRFYNNHNNTLHAFGTHDYSNLMLELIGAENPSSLEWVKEKKRNTYKERYEVDNPMKSVEIQDKVRITNLERYGGNSPFNSEEVKRKYVDNNLKKYGVSWPTQREEVKKKRENTYQEKYGTNNPLLNPTVKEKSLETLKSKYGVQHNSQIQSVKDNKRLGEQIRLHRYELVILEAYSKKYNVSLGSGWKQRKDIWVYQKLQEIYSEFGPL
jgi:hypothetical protein